MQSWVTECSFVLIRQTEGYWPSHPASPPLSFKEQRDNLHVALDMAIAVLTIRTVQTTATVSRGREELSEVTSEWAQGSISIGSSQKWICCRAGCVNKKYFTARVDITPLYLWIVNRSCWAINSLNLEFSTFKYSFAEGQFYIFQRIALNNLHTSQ